MRFDAMSTSLVSVRGLEASTIARTPVLFPVTMLPRTDDIVGVDDLNSDRAVGGHIADYARLNVIADIDAGIPAACT